MFCPSKVDAFKEARRALRQGGKFLFNVWDRIELNPFPLTVADAIAALYPVHPPNYPRRTPYGHHDVKTIRDQLDEAGFQTIKFVVVMLPTSCPSPREAAIAQLHGSPTRIEIGARDVTGLAEATDAPKAALAANFGDGQIESTSRRSIQGVALYRRPKDGG